MGQGSYSSFDTRGECCRCDESAPFVQRVISLDIRAVGSRHVPVRARDHRQPRSRVRRRYRVRVRAVPRRIDAARAGAVIGVDAVRVVRIPDRRRKHSSKPDRLRNGAGAYNASRIPQAFVVAEDECLVFENGTARSGAKLIPLPKRFSQSVLVREEVRGVQRAVSQKIVDGAVQFVAARPYNSVDERAGAPAEFRGVSVGLNFELLKRLNRRLNDLHIQPSEAV